MHSIAFICVILIFLGSSVLARNVKFTFYWIAFEEDFPIDSDYILRNCKGGTLTKISKAFSNSLHRECIGRLRTGEYIHGGDSSCNCFIKVPGPLGPKGNRLRPYISIATNDIPYGTKVFVRQLENIVLPNGKLHNGCVRVDDVGWSFGDNHIDFYVLRKLNYEKLLSYINDHVDIIVNSNCILQKY